MASIQIFKAHKLYPIYGIHVHYTYYIYVYLIHHVYMHPLAFPLVSQKGYAGAVNFYDDLADIAQEKG